MKQRFFLAITMIALCLPAWSQVLGDLNGDDVVDVTDVNMVIDIVLGKTPGFVEPKTQTLTVNGVSYPHIV